MKVYNNNQLYKLPAGDQLWNSGHQNWIFGCTGDQEGAISDPVRWAVIEIEVGWNENWHIVTRGQSHLLQVDLS